MAANDMQCEASEKHGRDGDDRVFVAKEIDDPTRAPTRRRLVSRLVRPRGIADMHAKGRITDRQKDIADRFYALYQRGHSDGLKAIDYSKVRVDCGAAAAMGVTDSVMGARDRVEAIRRHLGNVAFHVLVSAAVFEMSMDEIYRDALEIAGGERVTRRVVKPTLLKAIDDLGDLWGAKGAAPRGIPAALV